MAEENCNCPQSTGLATASLVLGIISVVFAFIPILNIVAYITATVGLILGIIGAVKKQGTKAVIGIILNAVAYFIPVIFAAIFVSSAAGAAAAMSF